MKKKSGLELALEYTTKYLISCVILPEKNKGDYNKFFKTEGGEL